MTNHHRDLDLAALFVAGALCAGVVFGFLTIAKYVMGG
jgi:hypothetical protein